MHYYCSSTSYSGDIILQNGANSGVGQAVIQLAANWGIASLNVVRDRYEFAQISLQYERLSSTNITLN
jgi:trans-2-enoyl-CoA reductase